MKFAHQIRVEVYAILSGMVPVAERNEQTVPLRVLPVGTTEDMMDLAQEYRTKLIEAVSDFESGQIQYLVVGIGLNCSTRKFPKELAETGGSLAEENEPFFRNALVAEVINHFIPLTYHLEEREFLSFYREHSMVIGKDITVYKGGFDDNSLGQLARAEGIDDNGGLIVEYKDGTKETLATGEISIRLNK